METIVTQSVWSRFSNAITSPREAFIDITNTKQKYLLWLVPVLLMIVISAVGVSLNGHLYREQSRKGMEERFDKMITEGKMTQAEADQARAKAEAFMGNNIMFYIGSAIWPFVKVFIVAALFLLVVNFAMKGQIAYEDVLATLGVSEIIAVLGLLVTMLLINVMGTLHASLSPALFITDFNQKNILHSVLSHLDVFTLWGLWVFGVGLSEVTGKSQSLAMKWVFGSWIVFTAITVSLGQLSFSFGG